MAQLCLFSPLKELRTRKTVTKTDGGVTTPSTSYGVSSVCGSAMAVGMRGSTCPFLLFLALTAFSLRFRAAAGPGWPRALFCAAQVHRVGSWGPSRGLSSLFACFAAPSHSSDGGHRLTTRSGRWPSRIFQISDPCPRDDLFKHGRLDTNSCAATILPEPERASHRVRSSK